MNIGKLQKHIRWNARLAKKMVFDILDAKQDSKKLMVNVGAGQWYRRHWKTLDYTGPENEYYIVKGLIDYDHNLASLNPLPFNDNSVSVFYSSHVIEHIHPTFCNHIFYEFYRCLKPGGYLRLTMPDYDLAKEALASNDIDFFKGIVINKDYTKDIQLNFETLTGTGPSVYSSGTSGKGHQNWWNYTKARDLLKSVGFGLVYRSMPQCSRCSDMIGLGRISGFDSRLISLSLFVEAVK